MRMIGAGLTALLIATAALAQDSPQFLMDRAAGDRPTLLVVGSGHFTNPGRDLVNAETPDITTPARQAEIEDVVRQLAAFAPTHVAVEWPAAAQAALDENYAAWRAGERALDVSEAEQIGFRLADAAGLERVEAIDWNGNPSGDEAEYDWPGYAQANGHEARLAAVAERAGSTPSLAGLTVANWLRAMNAPQSLDAAHQVYFDIAMVGGDDVQPGANWVGHWYGRNLRIFRNIVQAADAPDDRIVVIYGHGHAYLLRRFAQESGGFDLVDVQDVLAAAP